MSVRSDDTAPEIESALVDLGTTPLGLIRTTQHSGLHESLRLAVERTRGMRIKRISGGNEGGGRLD